MKEPQSNVIVFPGRPLQKVTEENAKERAKKKAQLVEFLKEYGPTAFYAVLWVIFIIIANI